MQKPEHGINYKEIDSLIANSKASGREFEGYKSDMKVQMDRMIENTTQEILSMREEV